VDGICLAGFYRWKDKSDQFWESSDSLKKESKMLVLVKDTFSKTGIVVRVQETNVSVPSPNERSCRLTRHYRCLFARPGKLLHADVTVRSDGTVSVADLFRALSMDRKGRKFLKGFKSPWWQLYSIPIDERTNIRELMEM